MLHLVATATVPGGDWTQLLTQGGAVGVLAAVVAGFVRGWLVSGTTYKEACNQRDRAVDQVYRLAETAQRNVEVTERIVRQ